MYVTRNIKVLRLKLLSELITKAGKQKRRICLRGNIERRFIHGIWSFVEANLPPCSEVKVTRKILWINLVFDFTYTQGNCISELFSPSLVWDVLNRFHNTDKKWGLFSDTPHRINVHFKIQLLCPRILYGILLKIGPFTNWKFYEHNVASST